MDADEQSTYRRTEPKGIDRLFLSLATVYGKRWFDQWAGIDMEAMKATWTRGLSGISGQQLRDALDYCADHEQFVPTLTRFREICESMRKVEPVKALPRHFTKDEIDRNRKRVHAAVSRLEPKTDYRAWAKKILANPKAYPDIAVRFAQEAMRMSVEAAA